MLVSNFEKGDQITQYESYVLLNNLVRGSRNIRSDILRVYNGFPVIWHKLYRDWIDRIIRYKKVINDKQHRTNISDNVKVETPKPSGMRPLTKPEPVPTLYSVREPPMPQMIQSNNSAVLRSLTTSAVNTYCCLKDSIKDIICNTRLGKLQSHFYSV